MGSCCILRTDFFSTVSSFPPFASQYSLSYFLFFHPCNSFTVYLPGSSLLKVFLFSSASCHLTSSSSSLGSLVLPLLSHFKTLLFLCVPYCCIANSAISNYSGHCSCWWSMNMWRYCSNSWFILSVVYGWNAVNNFVSIHSIQLNSLMTPATNCDPLLGDNAIW